MKKPSTGFTIIELMIATTILSVILVLVSAMAIKIGSLYTKGVNQSKIQDNVRTAMDEITQHLQLMGGSTAYQQAPTPTSAGALCIDSTRYTYVLDKQIGTNSPHVLWRDTMTSPATSNTTCTPATLTNNDPSSGTGGTNGQELEAPNSRLTAFCIGSYVSDTCTIPTTTSSPFSITIGMAYGDTDLTSNKGISTTCDKNIGDHYCATAYLSTIVDQRVGSVGVGGGGGSCTTRPSGINSNTDLWMPPSSGTSAPFPYFTTTPQASGAFGTGYHGPVHRYSNPPAGISPNPTLDLGPGILCGAINPFCYIFGKAVTQDGLHEKTVGFFTDREGAGVSVQNDQFGNGAGTMDLSTSLCKENSTDSSNQPVGTNMSMQYSSSLADFADQYNNHNPVLRLYIYKACDQTGAVHYSPCDGTGRNLILNNGVDYYQNYILINVCKVSDSHNVMCI